ncbi:MAG: UDP-N-acetylglucosamine--N-acetylmuramyl-(pentapeptide) pyrophosphoryl-undecaprenol N-acetylglucosamine transferase [Synergistaceae bacterium]|nr:UDP-N-acetylglucosamine--N-acetylmuramyl-(pentapeptide) pyrophosphoryl-undecaprenol N-acetylglucosamine transferase [Synergistaceae bacterium]
MTRRLVLVAGGTGGHILPAVSFGQWIEKNRPDVSVLYICGSRSLELEIYRSACIEPHQLPIEGSPFSGHGLDKLKRTCGQVTAVKKSVDFIREMKPECVLLFGGYISFPVLLACKILRMPVAVHEQNAYAGKVTRIASKMGAEIFSGWRECLPLPSSKFTRIGVPVRDFELLPPTDAWNGLGLPGEFREGPKLLVFSGSLGSRDIKDAVMEISCGKEFREWTFILPAVAEKTEKVNDNVFLLPKVWKTELLYSLADIAVVRAGGSTLTEVSVLGIPSLVIPWEGAADNHQYHNAVSFASENRSILWEGNLAAEDFAKSLIRLYDIQLDEKNRKKGKQYNKTGRMCEDLWLALSSYF